MTQIETSQNGFVVEAVLLSEAFTFEPNDVQPYSGCNLAVV